MPYTKTNWLTGDIITAAKLNNLETQYDQALAEVERLVYEAYRDRLALYYSGHFSGPDIAGLLAFTYDGFQNTDRVDIAQTTAQVDTTGKRVILPVLANGVTGLHNFNSSNSYIYQPTKWYVMASFSAAFILVAVYFPLSVNTPPNYSGTIKCEVKTGNPDTGTIVATTDTVSWNTSGIIEFTLPFSGSNRKKLAAGTQYYFVFTQTGTNVYPGVGVGTKPSWYLESKYWTGSAWSTFSDANASLRIDSATEYANNKRLRIAAKTLTFTPSKVKLYYSTKTGTNLTVSAPRLSLNGGTNFETPTLVSSRSDPLDATYTEYTYELANITYPGTSLTAYWDLFNTGYEAATPELKRYGIHLL